MARDEASFTSAPSEAVSPLAGLGFTLDGVRFACNGDVDTLDISELAILAVAAEDSRSPAGIATLAQFLQLALGPMEYVRFKGHTRQHHTDDDTLLAIIAMVNEHLGIELESQSARPTGRPSSFSDMQSEKDDAPSRVISLQQGSVRLVEDPDEIARLRESSTPA